MSARHTARTIRQGLAETRIGAELKAAQDRGEVQTAGGNRRAIIPQGAGNETAAALPDLNIPSQRASEYKALAFMGGQSKPQVARLASPAEFST